MRGSDEAREPGVAARQVDATPDASRRAPGAWSEDAGARAPAVDAGPGAEPERDAGAVRPIDVDAGVPDPDAGLPALPVEDAGAPAEPTGPMAPADPRHTDASPVDAGPSDAGAPSGAPVVDPGASPTVDAGASPTADAGASPTADAGLLPGAQLSAHTTLGLPDSSAGGVAAQWLLVKPQFVASYDTTRKTPRWVSWRLDTSWLGTATRATSFRRDAQLPTTVGQARDEDFRNSGFERGHLCPSADRTRSDPDNDATFVFTNVVPQTRASNSGAWGALEEESRTLARQGKTVMVVAGPVFGVTQQYVGAGVPVPTATFKVAVVLDGPPNAAAAVTTSTRVIAVMVPNTTSSTGPWRQHRVTVRAIEQATGLDLLADVPRAVQDVVETRLDAL